MIKILEVGSRVFVHIIYFIFMIITYYYIKLRYSFVFGIKRYEFRISYIIIIINFFN